MKPQAAELFRYLINGLFATVVHYCVLTANIKILGFDSSGLANFIAAFFGIITSFLGSRYFVFKRTADSMMQQAMKFGSMYGSVAVLHGLFLWAWTDWQGFDYRAGFLIATAIQVSLSYLGNKFYIFKP